jgi:hypothetical protein
MHSSRRVCSCLAIDLQVDLLHAALRFLWQLKLPQRCPNFADMFIKGVLLGSKFACMCGGVKVDGFNARCAPSMCGCVITSYYFKAAAARFYFVKGGGVIRCWV